MQSRYEKAPAPRAVRPEKAAHGCGDMTVDKTNAKTKQPDPTVSGRGARSRTPTMATRYTPTSRIAVVAIQKKVSWGIWKVKNTFR